MRFIFTRIVNKLVFVYECKKRKKKGGLLKILGYFDLYYGCYFDRIILNYILKERNLKGFDMNWLILRN